MSILTSRDYHEDICQNWGIYFVKAKEDEEVRRVDIYLRPGDGEAAGVENACLPYGLGEYAFA